MPRIDLNALPRTNRTGYPAEHAAPVSGRWYRRLAPAGAEDGHHLINESAEDCCFVAISAGADTGGSYPDIDMTWDAQGRYLHKDGRAYESPGRPG
jgi:hypothetical protein